MSRTCTKCGEREGAGRFCPVRRSMHANVGGHGWRRVPRRVGDCIDTQEGQAKLAEVVETAYARHRAREVPGRIVETQAVIEPEYLT